MQLLAKTVGKSQNLSRAGVEPTVRFALLGQLVSTGRRRGLWRKEFPPGAFIASLHLAAVLSLRLMTTGSDGPAPLSESVTYLDVPPAEAESPRAVLRPRPVVVSQAVQIPAVKGEVVHPDKMAGFQELLTPREVSHLPPPDPAAAAVDEHDFSGRGVAGGVAGGKPPPALPPELAASLAAQGLTSDVVAPVATRAMRPVEVEAVEIKPQLLNRDEILELLLVVYPPVLRQAGIEGSVTVQFIVDTAGGVSDGSARILSSSHALFNPGALEVVRHLKFSPGRMTYEGKLISVPVLVRAPFKWAQVEE